MTFIRFGISSLVITDMIIRTVLETHAHADHLTASQYFKRKFSSSHSQIPVCIGKNIIEVQKQWSSKYNIAPEEVDGVFDRLWEDDDEFNSGSLVWKVMHLPGHTVRIVSSRQICPSDGVCQISLIMSVTRSITLYFVGTPSSW